MDRREVILALLLGGGGVATGSGRAAAADTGRVFVSRIALAGGRVVMALKIGEAGPYLFAIDTGGFLSLIDDDLAKSLKLRSTGMTNASGVGGRTTMPVYLARDIVFGGGVRQPAVAFAGIGFGFKGQIKGTLAAGILTAMDSDLDIDAGEWRTYPDGHPPRIGYYRIDAAISDQNSGSGPGAGSRHLYGAATVDGRGFRFLLDTGAPGGLSLDQPAGRALGLWSDTRPYAPFRPSGIGGQAGVARIVRAESFTFGVVDFPQPLVMIRGKDDIRGGRVDGIIGLQVLRQFNLSTDVRARALWVKKHARPDTTLERYGLSGLWIDHDADRMTVAAVGTGSPAAGAGVKVGDRVVGEPFVAVLRKIGGGPGTPVTLSIERNGVPSSVSFTLARFL